ncbi:hypothetical protein SJDPG11_05900 [Porphyromonas gingivalis SJD11]|nr:hypothetical protein SJDPG11_05900 [Porphyromonas gingivalis SJD11]
MSQSRLLQGIFVELFFRRADSLCLRERLNLQDMSTEQIDIFPQFLS